MSGHSKWHSIKHKKAIVDAKRGKNFSKLLREIIVAVKLGGEKVSGNSRLRIVLQKAKQVNLPASNIEKAIKKASGQLGEGLEYEDFRYEGFGPGGVAIIVEGVTDNRNRTVAEIRRVFSKHGGRLTDNGNVSWMFEKRGIIELKGDVSEDKIMEAIIDREVVDIEQKEEGFSIQTSVSDLDETRKVLELISRENILVTNFDVGYVPKERVTLDAEVEKKVFQLWQALEEHEDIQRVFDNIK